MSKPTEVFILQFLLLEGNTLKERYKNFRNLLKETLQCLRREEKINLTLLHPRTPLEEIFKIDAAVYFKDLPEIIKILKSENVLFIKRILRTDSILLNEIFEDITGKELLKLFSHLSLNTKLKILNRLHLKNSKKGDEFFELIRENYGLYIASKIITNCSGEFIVRSLKVNKIEITCGQLVKIIKKNADFIEEIIDALHVNYMNDKPFEEKYGKVFVYLMKNNLELFLKLQEKYNKGEFCLGYRASKSFLRKKNKKIITENSNKFYKHLKRDIIYRNLSHDDFDVFYGNLFPKSSKEFKEKFEDLLEVAGHSRNVNLLFKMFKSVYGCYLGSEFINIKLLEIMSPDDREALMENYSRPKEIYEDHWISFMKTEQSLPILKEKISLTSNIKSRAKIVAYLVLTCKFNNDMVSLSDVCKYVVTKHHNDHWRVREGFLKTIMRNYNLDKLDEDHWESINKLLEVGFINKEGLNQFSTLLKRYMQFRLSRGLPIREQLKRWILIGEVACDMEDSHHHKDILIQMYDLIHLCIDESDIVYRYLYYLEALSKWNNKHSDDKFILYSYTKAMDHLKLALKKDEFSWQMESIILECIKLGINDEDKQEMLNLYLSCDITWMNGSLFLWLIKNDPMFVLNHTDTIGKLLIKCDRTSILLPLKYYSHLGIPQKMCKALKELMEIKKKDDDYLNQYSPDEYSSAIRSLSYLLSTTEFLEFVQSYYPVKSTIEILNEDDRQNRRSLKAIAVGIRNIFPCSQAIEPILKFCKGDYLNLIQKTLYLVAYNIAENKLQYLFDEMSTGAVSVRKHPIHLASKILNKRDTYSIFEKFRDDKNLSIRKCLLKATFNFLCNNPHEQSWELFKEHVKNLDSNDQEALDVLTQWKKIPKIFYEKYITFTWDILENMSDDSKRAEERKGQLSELILIQDVIKVLPKEFIENIIRKYFLQSQGKLYGKINSLTVKYIMYCNSRAESKEKLDFVFKILSGFCKQSQEEYHSVITMHKRISDFINKMCINYSKERKTLVLGIETFSDFITRFGNTFEVCKFLDEYLQLQFSFICVASKIPAEVSTGLLKLYDSLLQKIGLSITESFRKSLRSSITHLLLSNAEDEAERNRYALMNEIRKCNDSVNRTLLVIFLLPDERPAFKEFKIKYNVIIQYILKEQDSTVQIYFHKYLKSLDDGVL